MLDSFYTPKDAAQKLVSGLGFAPKIAGDFCVGGGELLRACEALFPKVQCIAIDKSKKAVKNIRAKHKGWQTFLADFLNDEDLVRAGLAKSSCDLVVLNPPFTCRGNRYRIEFDGQVFSGGKALLFLTRAMSYVRKGGVLRAILPSGTISSERDALLVRHLKRVYRFRTYWRSSEISFGGKMPNVVFVDMQKPMKQQQIVKSVPAKKFVPPSYLSRGCLNVVDAGKVRRRNQGEGALRYVHTTDLRNGEICDAEFYVPKAGRRIVSGPGVLLPRVGMPKEDKICIMPSGCHFVLSDCVIAIRCRSMRSAMQLKQALLKHWDSYRQIYVGTGARYTTLKRLSAFLDRVEVS